jgi:hypothetical protein
MKQGHALKFCGYDETVKAQGGRTEINRSLYDEVYDGEVNCKDLEDVFHLLNMNHPADYKGHSLSVSDVIRTSEGYFFCDSVGFKQIEFTCKQKVQLTGQDGNVFNLMSICSLALEKAGMPDKAQEMIDRITTMEEPTYEHITGYDKALQIMMEYCDVE